MNSDGDHIDPALDALLRAYSVEMPSTDVDAAIVAAAHRAVQSAPQSAGATRPWRRWMPLAAAATIGAITIGVLEITVKSPDTTSTIVSDSSHVAREAPAMKMRTDRAEQAPAANVQAQRAPAQAKPPSADVSARTPADWIERIRALLREDKAPEAAQELSAFR